jgi:uncharacterized protein (TIGR02145 family)
MKRLITFTLLTVAIFASCSKSNTSIKPQTTTTTAVITDSVSIGSQTWTTVNYNGTGGENYANSSVNDPTYGKLYTLAEAKAIALPNGWRIPTTDDFNKLMVSVGATAQDSYGYYHVTQDEALELMSTTNWTSINGTNTSGFNAYPAGFFNGGFDGKGEEADFITTSILAGYPGTQANFSLYEEVDTNNALIIDAVFSDEVGAAADRGSIRFVKDN